MEQPGVTRVEVTPEIKGPTAPTAPETKPEWVPEKFYKEGKVDYEGMAKGYSELEKKLGSSQPAEQKPTSQTPTQTQPQTTPANIPGVAPEQVSKFTEELTKDGSLSKDSYDALAKAGYSKEVVDAYVQGQAALASKAQNDAQAMGARVKGTVGGEEAYTQMTEWATANLSDGEIEAFNKAVASQDEGVVTLAVQGLHSKFVQANGREGKFLEGKTSTTRGDVYKSSAEMKADMKSDRYKKDEAFRKEVAEKLARSNIM